MYKYIKTLSVFILLLYCLSVRAKDTIPQLGKNTIRMEFLAKSPILGLLYERELIQKKWSTYLSVGMGLGNTRHLYPYPTMYNFSVYFTYNRWRVKPLIGVGTFTWVEYNPYPSTVAERTLMRKGLGDMGGSPLAPPFTFYETLIAGIKIQFRSRWSCQILYTHYFNYDFIIGQYQGSNPFGGFNLGYTF